MRTSAIVVAVVVVVGVGIGLLFSVNRTTTPSNSSTVTVQNQNTSTSPSSTFTTTNAATDLNTTVNPVFTLEKKSAHYVSNTPNHGTTVTAPPSTVTINFNFDLASQSVVSVTRDGKEYGTGQTVVADNQRVLERGLDPNAPDGVYTVNYSACWPDGSCHTGTFQFAIDRP